MGDGLMAIGAHFVGNTLRLCALGCGATGVLLLPVHPLVGAALCVVALADLGLVWRLRSRTLDLRAQAGLSP
jgi:hypothetical protein